MKLELSKGIEKEFNREGTFCIEDNIGKSD